MICQTEAMEEARAAEVMAESAVVLRNAGARFAYLYGSRASGQYRAQPGDRRRGGHRQPAAGAGLRGRDQSASTSTSAGSPHGTSPRTGPEFSELGRGTYQMEQISLCRSPSRTPTKAP
jgi:hypothetical protein